MPAMRPSAHKLHPSTHHHAEPCYSLRRHGEPYGGLSEGTRDGRRRRASALTSDVPTTVGHDAVDREHVRPPILLLCSSLPGRRSGTCQNTSRNMALVSATEFAHGVFAGRIRR